MKRLGSGESGAISLPNHVGAASVTAELVPAPALDQVREAADLARAWGWAGRLVRQRLAQIL